MDGTSTFGVLDGRTINSVDNLLGARAVNDYTLQGLAQTLSAVLVYDRVGYIFADAFRQAVSLSGEGWFHEGGIIDNPDTRTDFFGPIPIGEGDKDPFKDCLKLDTPRFESVMLATGLAYCPHEYAELVQEKYSMIKETEAAAALRFEGAGDLYERMSPSDQKLFRDWYLATCLWTIDLQKLAMQHNSATGIVYSPSNLALMQTTWGLDRADILSSSFDKIGQLEREVLRRYVPPGFDANLSPLLAILLDTTPSLEMLPETMFTMRRDYAEIRDVTRTFNQAIKAADTYNEVAEISREWEDMWKSVLDRIGGPKAEKPNTKVLTWDTFSALTPNGVLGKATGRAIGRLQDATVRRSFGVLFNVEKEFLASRLMASNIKRLFGDGQTSAT